MPDNLLLNLSELPIFTYLSGSLSSNPGVLLLSEEIEEDELSSIEMEAFDPHSGLCCITDINLHCNSCSKWTSISLLSEVDPQTREYELTTTTFTCEACRNLKLGISLQEPETLKEQLLLQLRSRESESYWSPSDDKKFGSHQFHHKSICSASTSILSEPSDLAPLDGSTDTLPNNLSGFPSSSDRKRSASMMQGKDIEVYGGQFTTVAGDYHEHKHTTYILNDHDLEESGESFAVLQAAFTKLDDLFSLLKSKINEDDRGAAENMTDIEAIDDEYCYEPDQNKFHFNSLNDPPPVEAYLDEEYIIYETPSNSLGEPPRRPLHTDLLPAFPLLPILYFPYWFYSYCGRSGFETAWLSPPIFPWPQFS